MTDQNIPADKVEEIIAEMNAELSASPKNNEWSDGYDKATSRHKARLEALLTTTRPTLADMTSEERAECQWMQAETEQWGRVVITQPCESGIQAVLLTRQGYVIYERYTRITPRPDLPRMEWPGEQKRSLASPDGPALPDGWRLADHPDHGRIIVTKSTPDNSGDICFVNPTDAFSAGYERHYCDPAEMTYLNTTQEKKND